MSKRTFCKSKHADQSRKCAQCLNDQRFCIRYKLKADDAILAAPEHADLYDQLQSQFKCDYHPGGQALNTMKVAGWCLLGGSERLSKSNTEVKRAASQVAYLGCVGRDREADTLRNEAENLGVHAWFDVRDNMRTGVCAALLTGRSRSLVTTLGAACSFDVKHLDHPESIALLERTRFFYIGVRSYSFLRVSCFPKLL